MSPLYYPPTYLNFDLENVATIHVSDWVKITFK